MAGNGVLIIFGDVLMFTMAFIFYKETLLTALKYSAVISDRQMSTNFHDYLVNFVCIRKFL